MVYFGGHGGVIGYIPEMWQQSKKFFTFVDKSFL
jgi:hypothetical protein